MGVPIDGPNTTGTDRADHTFAFTVRDENSTLLT
jgi:hypothetical protein